MEVSELLEQGRTAPDADKLEHIGELASKQRYLETLIKTTEDILKDYKEQHREVSQKSLPSAMLECGLTMLALDNGDKIAIEENIYVSGPAAPAKKLPFITKFLKDNKEDALIKNQVVVEFGKGEEEKAEELEAELKKHSYSAERKQAVNTSSLKAVCRELEEGGVVVPYEDLGLMRVTETVLEKRKG